jgi:acyl-CoA reductase-like NAD-dependent aldehyde dehydrogenase
LGRIQDFDLIIDGRMVGADRGGTFERLDPVTPEVTTGVAAAGLANVETAVASRRKPSSSGRTLGCRALGRL